MHFSGHSALLQAGNGIGVYEFDPSEGLEVDNDCRAGSSRRT